MVLIFADDLMQSFLNKLIVRLALFAD